MGEGKNFERIPPIRPGDEVLRRRVRPRRRLRLAPHWPAFLRFLKDIATRTPFLPILSVLIVCMLLFAMGIYFAEHNAANTRIDSFGDALYWVVVSMQTMGSTGIHPITGAGKVLTGVWAFVGTGLFWGTIIATIAAYFMLPRQRPSQQIIATVQYNLEKLDDLSLEELETLKGAAVGLIEARIERIKEAPHH